MENKEIEIKIMELDNNIYFFSNKKIEGEEVSYDLNAVKGIFELNPLPTTEIKDGNSIYKISFCVEYDHSKETFYISMLMGNEKVDSTELSLIDMLDILIDVYSKGMLIHSHKLISSKVSGMLNNYSYGLIREGKIPNMKLMLQGEGEIRVNNKVVGLFDRLMLYPESNEMLLCEAVGEIPYNSEVKVSIKTDVGVTIEVDNVVTDIPFGNIDLMGITYVIAYLNVDSIIEKMELFKNEEFNFTQDIITLPSQDMIASDAQSAIGFCIDKLNENSSEKLTNFVRYKKELLFKEEEESYLLDQVDDLFDDLF